MKKYDPLPFTNDHGDMILPGDSVDVTIVGCTNINNKFTGVYLGYQEYRALFGLSSVMKKKIVVKMTDPKFRKWAAGEDNAIIYVSPTVVKPHS